MIARLRSLALSPYTAMGLVIVMYIAKVIAKMAIGSSINSPTITGDGYHNSSDIAEAFLVIAILVFARRQADDKYPFGRKNAESIFQLAVGVLLGSMALQIGFRSLRGLVEYLPPVKHALERFITLPAHEPLRMGPEYFWWVTGVMAVSAVLSVLASWYQIYVGRHSGHASLVADGQETRGDGVIELVVLVGVLGEYLLGAPWLEYPLGLFVAGLLVRTGWENLSDGWRKLLQRSIGAEHEAAIRDTALETHGVLAVAELKTFQAGDMAVLIMKVTTRCGAQAALDIKSALAARIGPYMAESGFDEWDHYIRFDKPEPARRRIAYAVTLGPDADILAGRAPAARGLADATHFMVCDVEDGRIVRVKTVAASGDPAQKVRLLQDKRVSELRAFAVEDAALQTLSAAGIAYADTVTYLVDPAGASTLVTT